MAPPPAVAGAPYRQRPGDARSTAWPSPSTAQPAAGDAFELSLATPSLSVFDTLDRAIAELNTPLRSNAAVAQGVQRTLADLDDSMGALQSLRSRVGEVLNRTDMVEGRIADQALAAQIERSRPKISTWSRPSPSSRTSRAATMRR